MRQGDGDVRTNLLQDIARRNLAARVKRREDRGNGHRTQPEIADVSCGRAHAGRVERHDRPAVIIVPAFEHENLAAHALGQILRPIAKWWQGSARRHADPDRRNLHQMPALHHRIDEMRCADHNRIHRQTRRGIGAQRLQGVEDAGSHIHRRGALDGENHLVAIEQHGVGIGAADVNSNASHDVTLQRLSAHRKRNGNPGRSRRRGGRRIRGHEGSSGRGEPATPPR